MHAGDQLHQRLDNENNNQVVGKLRWCKGLLCGCAAASPPQSWSNWFWHAHVQGREEKKSMRRDQRQTLYCHITGPCCILNSTNLSKQSDKILRWRDAPLPLPFSLPAPSLPLSASIFLHSLLWDRSLFVWRLSGDKWCTSHGAGMKTLIHLITTSSTTYQRLDRC